MDFVTAIKTCLLKYATFKGRAGRAEYWWWYLFSLIWSMALYWAPVGMRWPVSVIFFLPGISVSVRRLHDIDLSGWWILMPYLVWLPAVILGVGTIFSTIMTAAGTPTSQAITSALQVAGSPVVVLCGLMLAAGVSDCVYMSWLCRKGTEGPNRFGLL